MKETLKNVGLFCYDIHKEIAYTHHKEYTGDYPYQTCHYCYWNYSFDWFSNNCTLNVEHYNYEDNGYNIREESTTNYKLKIEDWKFDFQVTNKGKSLESQIYESFINVREKMGSFFLKNNN